MISFLMNVAAFLIVLLPLVFVHELGHFIVAKSFGVRVPVFSFGIGPRLFGITRGGTDYRVSAVPLGGYVRLAGEEGDESHTGAPDEFMTKTRWQRFLVYLAGATFNILLAIGLATMIFWIYGVDEIANPTAYPVVADVVPGSPAEAAGVRVGDKVLSIEGRDALDAQTLTEEIIMSPETRKHVELERDGKKITVELQTGQDERYHLGSPGWHLFRQGTGPPIIKVVMPGSPAESAGLAKGDKVIGLDDRTDLDEAEVRAMLAGSPERRLTLHVERSGQVVDIPVTPRNDGGKGRIGVEFVNSALVNRKVSLGQAFVESLRYNWEASRGLLKALKSVGGRLSKGEVGAVRAFSGPIEIANLAVLALQDVQAFLSFMCVLSLNLGIINLLPIPVLDGGHLLILVVEGAMRRELSIKVKERVLQLGFAFLLAFFTTVIFFDVVKRWFSS